MKPESVKGYDIAVGHLPWRPAGGSTGGGLLHGYENCCIGMISFRCECERYDLVIRTKNLSHPGIQVLLDTLGRTAFRGA